ncbi:hypothetical protein BBJ28_00017463 [Nothophytophthora sp. Chile5]|nr:hypothetical protein BBJ28_00017463 [Nothophytophthora sp. Chile5]
MLQSLLSSEFKPQQLSPLVPGLLAISAVVALYPVGVRAIHKAEKDAALPSGIDAPVRVPYLSPGLPLLGHTLELARNSHRFLDWLLDLCHSREGKPFVLKLLGKNDLMITAVPEHHEQILKTQFENFIKGDHLYEMLVDVAGPNVVIIEGERWKYQRKVLVNLFSTRVLREHMMPIVQKHTQVLLEIFSTAASDAKPIELGELLHRFTLDSFTEIGFGSQLGSLAAGREHPFGKALDDALHIAAARRFVLKWVWKAKRWLNVGSERQLHEAVQVMDSLVMRIISDAIEQRSHRNDPNLDGQKAVRDIVSIILDRMQADGQSVEPSEVRSIALLSLIAGRDTTANALAWLLHMLHEHPNVEGKLRAELLARFPKLATSEDYVPSVEELQHLPYLEATISEVLRLFPIFPYTSRQCIKDTVFPDGTFVREGTDIGLPHYAMARLPSVWGPTAAEFIPERFLDSETGEVLDIPAATSSAFGAGPRVCVGRRLATLEMKLVVASIVGRFHLTEVPGQDVGYKVALSLTMKNPLVVTVERVDRVVADSA